MNLMPTPEELIIAAQFAKMGMKPPAGIEPVKPPRVERFKGKYSQRKARNLQVMTCQDVGFWQSLEGKWLRRWLDFGGDMPERQYKFHPKRRFRFDFAFEKAKVAVEVDGGTYVFGGHNRGRQIRRDAEKQNAAQAMGWRVFRFTTDMIDLPGEYEKVREAVSGVCVIAQPT